MECSVLILVKDRRDHLRWVLRGIERSILQPTEIIVVHMNEVVDVIDSPLPIRQLTLQSPHSLPLAAARNAAAQQAAIEQLIFLDVDCIPAPNCFGQLLNDLANYQLVMADPHYLSQAVSKINYALFERDGRPSPARRDIVFGSSMNFELFWSLGFAIRRSDFVRIGGFDESFVGYGGEDTDFAFRARRAGLTLCYSRARIYHQNHPSYDPPLNWLEDIVSNAQYFYDTWGSWPMRGWLTKFADAGYINWSGQQLTLKRLPTEAEIAAAKKPNAF